MDNVHMHARKNGKCKGALLQCVAAPVVMQPVPADGPR